MPAAASNPIGVFDSGVGGLSVLRALRADMDRALHLHRGGRLDERGTKRQIVSAGISRNQRQVGDGKAQALASLRSQP